MARGNAYAKEHKWKEAAACWEKGRAEQPNDEQVYLLLHNAYVESGNLDADLKIQKEFVAKFPNSKYQKQMADAAKYYEKDFATTKAGAGSTSGRTVNDNELWHAQDMPLKVYVNDRLKGRTVWTADNGKGGNETFSTLIEQAWNEWASASSGKASFVICDDPNDANIICNWTDDYSKFKLSFAAGETVYGRNKHGKVCCTLNLLTSDRDKKPVSRPIVLQRHSPRTGSRPRSGTFSQRRRRHVLQRPRSPTAPPQLQRCRPRPQTSPIKDGRTNNVPGHDA